MGWSSKQRCCLIPLCSDPAIGVIQALAGWKARPMPTDAPWSLWEDGVTCNFHRFQKWRCLLSFRPCVQNTTNCAPHKKHGKFKLNLPKLPTEDPGFIGFKKKNYSVVTAQHSSPCLNGGGTELPAISSPRRSMHNCCTEEVSSRGKTSVRRMGSQDLIDRNLESPNISYGT